MKHLLFQIVWQVIFYISVWHLCFVSSGSHSAVYQAEPTSDAIHFVKIKTTKSLESAKHSHTKVGLHQFIKWGLMGVANFSAI